LEDKNPYDISVIKESGLSAQSVLQKLKSYAANLGLKGKGNYIEKLYADMPSTLTLREKYKTVLKLISMSSEYLYIDFNKGNGHAARYMSYSLLKQTADESFELDYQNFKSSRLSPLKLAGKIIKNSAFENFLTEFTKGWLQYDVELDSKKFNLKFQSLNDQQETVAYLKYIFEQNRPLKEVFQSDYKILNSKMSPYYELTNSSKGSFSKHSKTKGGVLEQMAFFRSQSDGIDGLPFRRAQWISENILNQRLGNPPNNISSEEFEAGKNLKTFRERTKHHSKHSGCYDCHKVLDPVAFAISHRGALGQLVDSPETEFIQQFSERLQQTEQEQVRAFTKNLLQFITGRNLTVYDHLVIEKFIKDNKTKSYKSAALLEHILIYYFK
jgi:hypothetical protein